RPARLSSLFFSLRLLGAGGPRGPERPKRSAPPFQKPRRCVVDNHGHERTPLHERAQRAALKLCRRYEKVPQDVRTVISFWQASRASAERAARALLAYAGEPESETHEKPRSAEPGGWGR